MRTDHNGKRYAVIVNDMSELNIVGPLVQRHIQQQDEKLVEMSNGCICCTLREDLLKEVAALSRLNKFDHLIIESTGISEPMPVAETFTFLLDTETDSNADTEVETDGSDLNALSTLIPTNTANNDISTSSTSSVSSDSFLSSLSDIAEIDTMVTVVDAVNFVNDLQDADDLLSRGLQADENDVRTLTDLLVSQVSLLINYIYQ